MIAMDPQTQTLDPCGFVAEALRRCSSDTSYRAALQRADNPDTAAFAWEYLVKWCDITKDHDRLPFALIGAAIAREKPASNGNKNLGELFRACCKDENDMEYYLKPFVPAILVYSENKLQSDDIEATFSYFYKRHF